MEAAGLAFSVAQTLFAALKCDELKQIWALLGFDFDPDSLEKTVETIKCVLLDFEEKEMPNNQEQNFIQRLKAAVYKADDLFDEFNALVEQQKEKLDRSGKVSRKVRLFLSCFGELGVARKLSRSFRKVREELDHVASDANQFSFRFGGNGPVRRRREESSCHVNEREVIGRKQETREVVDRLLAPNVENDVVVIVGAVGHGKTTLAQLVYNNDKVEKEFERRFWVCVTHHDQNHGLVGTVLPRILESATGRSQDGVGLEPVQMQVRNSLHGKKFLLVLDDLWSENRSQWLELKNIFAEYGHGSRILVTTCSKKTAQIVGCTHPYELERLSEENSWTLLKRIAFRGQSASPELENVGKNIIRNCGNVPLSIRLIGNFLYGQGKEKWFQYQHRGLSMLKHQGNPFLEIEKLDYLHLQSHLKSCFSYCAVFPKNSVIEKETLISLWMAHGFAGNQTDEDHYEDCFSNLLERFFFQDVECDEFGEIISCKMQNLVHALAVGVAGNEICILNSSSTLNGETHHVSYHIGDENLIRNYAENSIRTFLRADSTVKIDDGIKFPVDELMEKWACLRVLDLHSLNLQQLPKDIGTLIHLRYLDVSSNPELKELPKSVTRLHYLQTLKMRGCLGVKQLPKNFSKLCKLRLFDALDSGLKSMPSGMTKLVCLRRLSMFVLGARSSEQKQVGDLQDLRDLKDLKGKLQVKIKEKYKYVQGSTKEEYLRNMEHLNELEIRYDGEVDGEEALIEDMQPHHNIKGLTLRGYSGVRIPSWATTDNLPNLVRFNVTECVKLQELTALGQLQSLKFIEIVDLENLEYLGEASSVAEEPPLFPSVEKLHLINLPKLREWRRGSTSALVSLPNVSELKIENCPNLKCTFVCPKVEKPSLNECNATLSTMIEEDDETGAASEPSSHLVAS